MRRQTGLIVVLLGLAGGCTHPAAPLVVDDPDPSVKIPAIKKAVQNKDLSAVRQLVVDLDSDDPAVRLYAINGLERLTGEQFGYEYYADAALRRPAVVKWRQWLESQVPTTQGKR